MHKCFALLATITFLSTTIFAQDVTGDGDTNIPPIKKPSRDFVMLQFNYNNWAQKPAYVNVKGLGYGFNGFVCYDFPIKKTSFSFAAGLGVKVSVIYLNQQVLSNRDTSATGAPAATFAVDTMGYKRYKFVTTYLSAPLELRYFSNKLNRNKGFKAAIGVQVGTLLGSHTKGVRSVGGSTIKDKENTTRYVSTWDFAATARVGYGNFSLFGSYNITNVFKDSQGPVITPYAIGICLSGL
jgi:hypothetical protein